MTVLLPAAISTYSLLLLFLVFLIFCSLLIFFILLQRGKGEGLAGLLGGGGGAEGMGTPEAQKDLSRWTTYLSTLFFLMCIVITVISTRCGGVQREAEGPISDEPEAPAPPAPAVPDITEEPASPEVAAASPEIDAQTEQELLDQFQRYLEEHPELLSPEAEAPPAEVEAPPLVEAPPTTPRVEAPPTSPEG